MKVSTRQRFAIILGIVSLFTVVVVSLILMQPRPFSATIKVVDEKGKPVTGATIKPNGLRSKDGPSAFGWNPRPKPVQTDAKGEATIVYPRFVMERVETGTIIFQVDHPDYAAQNENTEQVVDHSPSSSFSLMAKARYYFDRIFNPSKFLVRPPPPVLKAGGVVKVSGFLGQEENVITTNIFPRPRDLLGWQTLPAGTMFSKRFPPGPNYLRLVHFPEGGRTCFSDLISFVAKPNATNEFRLKLKPGKRVKVRLDSNVPRPVSNGRVVLRIDREYSTDWHAWRKLDPDGTCVFESLPAGNVKIIGICDGYISSNGPTPTNGAGGGRMCISQTFTLEDDRAFELEMEPTAICEVRVLDPAKKPLAGAKVMFWPNAIGTGGIFARTLVNSDETVRTLPSDKPRYSEIDSFSAVTDRNGLAVIKSLPGFGQREFFSVEHKKFDMPSDGNDRYDRVLLNSGKTSSTTVIMEIRGIKPLEYVP